MTVQDRDIDVARLPWVDGVDAQQLAATRHIESGLGSREGELKPEFPFGWQQRAADEVAQSWRRQMLLMDVEGVTVRIQARLAENAYAGVLGDQGAPQPGWPFAGDVLVAGSVRGPATYFFDEFLASRDELHHQAKTFLVDVRGGILVDRRHEWSESAVIAVGLRSEEGEASSNWQERFFDICHQLGIDTVVRLRDGQWQVLTLCGGAGGEVQVLSSDPCSITIDVDRRCVMLPAPERGQYCQMRGGPWTSASIHAAAAWKDHRMQIGSSLRCDTCEGKRYLHQGRVTDRGGPSSVVKSPVPTRWLAPLHERIVMDGGDDA